MSGETLSEIEPANPQDLRMALRSMMVPIPRDAEGYDILNLALQYGLANTHSLGVESGVDYTEEDKRRLSAYGKILVPLGWGHEVLQLVKK